MLKRLGIFAGAAALLLGCAGHPVVADISQDKVIIQGNGAPPGELLALANESCGMYKRRAQYMSERCGDGYCIQKIYLYACRPVES